MGGAKAPAVQLSSTVHAAINNWEKSAESDKSKSADSAKSQNMHHPTWANADDHVASIKLTDLKTQRARRTPVRQCWKLGGLCVSNLKPQHVSRLFGGNVNVHECKSGVCGMCGVVYVCGCVCVLRILRRMNTG